MGNKKDLTYPSDCACTEDIKNVKRRLSEAKENLRSGAELLNSVDMNYEARLQAIGSLYMNVHRIKQQLSHYKKQNKQ